MYAFIVGDVWRFRINLEKIKTKNEEDFKPNVPITQNSCSLFLGEITILI
jgi:hypothetical protein